MRTAGRVRAHLGGAGFRPQSSDLKHRFQQNWRGPSPPQNSSKPCRRPSAEFPAQYWAGNTLMFVAFNLLQFNPRGTTFVGFQKPSRGKPPSTACKQESGSDAVTCREQSSTGDCNDSSHCRMREDASKDQNRAPPRKHVVGGRGVITNKAVATEEGEGQREHTHPFLDVFEDGLPLHAHPPGRLPVRFPPAQPLLLSKLLSQNPFPLSKKALRRVA